MLYFVPEDWLQDTDLKCFVPVEIAKAKRRVKCNFQVGHLAFLMTVTITAVSVDGKIRVANTTIFVAVKQKT